MNVNYSTLFKQYLKNFPKADQLKILAFVAHVEEYGLINLQGRNKSSDNVPTNNPNWLIKVKYAQKYNLWHYHIGIPNYETASNGEQTSEYILHYIREADSITLVELSAHPPFNLPSEEYLK